jgi:hypothetical protein
VAALALAGCGSSSSGSGSPPSSSATGSNSSSAPGSAGGSSNGSDTAVRTALTTTSHADSARLTMQETVKAQGKSVTLDGNGLTTLKGSGQASDGKGQFTMAVGGQNIQMRQLGTMLYEQMPPGAARQKLSGGKPWIRIDTTKVTSSLGGTDQAPDASAQLGYLQHAQRVSKVGAENVDGAATTHYRMTVAPDALDMSGVKAVKPMAIDIWVDAQHRVRVEKAALDFTATTGTGSAAPDATTNSTSNGASGGGSSSAAQGSVTFTMHLKDFGTPVKVTAPPSSQVTDATKKVASAAGGGTSA